MKRKLIYLFIASAVLLASTNLPLRAQDQTVSGNLSVTGTSDLEGNTLNVGSWSGTSNQPGLAVIYVDGTTAGVNFIANRPTAAWQWWTNDGTQNVSSMALDQNSELILYSGTVAAIILSPSGVSAFAGDIISSGTNSTLPNQVLMDDSSILTQGLGDGRYLTPAAGDARYIQGGATIVMGSGNVGIGTATPAYPLDVVGDGAFSGTFRTSLLQTDGNVPAYVSGLGSTQYQTFLGHVLGGGGFDGDGIAFTSGTGGTSVMGIVLNGDTLFLGDANRGANYVTIDAAGAYYTAAQGILSTGHLIVNTSAGIGTATPGYTLDVAGDINFTGNVYQNGNAISGGGGSLGYGTVASGGHATAAGYYSTASGKSSTAMGTSSATGDNSTALGSSSAIGTNSMAMGVSSSANGTNSTALGSSYASGTNSTALSTTEAFGDNSTSLGYITAAIGMDQFVIGLYNSVQGDLHSWVATDDLFEIGTGTGSRSNAMVVKKNGNATISGTVTVKDLVFSGTGGPAMSGTGGVSLTGTLTSTVANLTTLSTSGTANMGILSLTGSSTILSGNGNAIISGTTTTTTLVTSGSGTIGGSLTAASLVLSGTSGTILSGTGNVTIAGTETATSFVGNGTGLTGILHTSGSDNGTFASLISTGTASIGNGVVIVSGTSAQVNGALVVTGTAGIPGQINGVTKINGGLIVTGTAVTSGTTTTIVSSGTHQFLVPQQGDISMGAFTAGATPQ